MFDLAWPWSLHHQTEGEHQLRANLMTLYSPFYCNIISCEILFLTLSASSFNTWQSKNKKIHFARCYFHDKHTAMHTEKKRCYDLLDDQMLDFNWLDKSIFDLKSTNALCKVEHLPLIDDFSSWNWGSASYLVSLEASVEPNHCEELYEYSKDQVSLLISNQRCYGKNETNGVGEPILPFRSEWSPQANQSLWCSDILAGRQRSK